MAFHFSLEALLRFRRSLERQQELLLQEANYQVSLIRRQIADIDLLLASRAAQTRQELRQGVAAAELHFGEDCESMLRHHRKHLERQALQKEELRRERMEALKAARRGREVVETLRQQQFQVHRQDETRQEQRRLDDQFLLRRNFLPRS